MQCKKSIVLSFTGSEVTLAHAEREKYHKANKQVRAGVVVGVWVEVRRQNVAELKQGVRTNGSDPGKGVEPEVEY